MEKIIIIDDDDIIRKIYKTTLTKEGYDVIEAQDGIIAMHYIKSERPDLILTDQQMPGKTGLELISDITKMGIKTPVIMLTAHGDIALTIKSIQRGVFEYLEKPTPPDILRETVRRALDSVKISQSLPDITALTNALKSDLDKNFLVGKTPKMKEIFKNIGMISMNKVNVLIEGKTGTGKELIARLIHLSGSTRNKPLVVVNCSALTESLLESELFGHVKGSFTDSIRDKKGKFELAADGTIFLDEISEMSHNTQVKLLRVLQELEFEKVGGEETIPMRARIITATNKNLEELIKEGKFREDLYYRLKVFTIQLPPLKERKEDIEDLVIHFMKKLNKKFGKNVTKIGDGVIEMLQDYCWPGNVRELENTILQAIVMSKNDVIEKHNIVLNTALSTNISDRSQALELKSLSEIEKDHIEAILNRVNWNKVEASRILGITRPTLNSKIEKYNLAR